MQQFTQQQQQQQSVPTWVTALSNLCFIMSLCALCLCLHGVVEHLKCAFNEYLFQHFTNFWISPVCFCVVLQVDKRKQCADSCWLRSLAGQKTTRIINRQQPAKLQPTTNNNNNNIDFYIRNAFLKANKGNALHANIAASSLEATSHSHTNTPHTLQHTTHTHTHTT